MKEKGITLVEIIIAILIVTLFSAILISDFPRILKQFALSRATYKLAQDLRKTQDFGLSGVKTSDNQEELIIAKGYGVYFNLSNDTEYIIYADRGENPDFRYNGIGQFCIDNDQKDIDCILESIDISKENPDLFISGINNIDSNYTSINFVPPNPTTEIENISYGNFRIGIVLGLRFEPSRTRTVWVNKSGLIQIK